MSYQLEKLIPNVPPLCGWMISLISLPVELLACTCSFFGLVWFLFRKNFLEHDAGRAVVSLVYESWHLPERASERASLCRFAETAMRYAFKGHCPTNCTNRERERRCTWQTWSARGTRTEADDGCRPGGVAERECRPAGRSVGRSLGIDTTPKKRQAIQRNLVLIYFSSILLLYY